MTSLIDSLLTLARADAGMEALRFETVDANQLALEVGEKWKTAMRVAFLSFDLKLAPQPPFVHADRNALRRLLTILLDNAQHYTPLGGSVDLRVACEGGRVLFTVEDTGIGIAPEHQPRIFDRFYRVDRTRGYSSCGSGLGLALAKWIADRHATSISLQSGLGKGSSFGFALPVVAGAVGSNSDVAAYSISRS
jgi:signal transduction histidine kinase